MQNLPTGTVELQGRKYKRFYQNPETPPIYIKEDLDAGENIDLNIDI